VIVMTSVILLLQLALALPAGPPQAPGKPAPVAPAASRALSLKVLLLEPLAPGANVRLWLQITNVASAQPRPVRRGSFKTTRIPMGRVMSWQTSLLLLLGTLAAQPSLAQERLAGCDDPRDVVARLRPFNLTSSDWHTITEPRLIERWGRPLVPLGREFLWLSSGGRIINAEVECAVEFWLRTTLEVRGRVVEGLDEVRVYYTSADRSEVIQAAELLHKEWSPPAGAELYDFQRAKWEDAKRDDGEATYQYEWHTQWKGRSDEGVTIMHVSTRVYRSTGGWTTSNMLELTEIKTN
jgi:hypothetical protein